MRRFATILLPLLALVVVTLPIRAASRSDTVTTSQGDQIYIDYDIRHDGNRVTIKLTKWPAVRLGAKHRGKFNDEYQDQRFKFLYFEQNKGKYEKLKKSNHRLTPIRVTGADLVSSDVNDYGYILLQLGSQLVFTLDQSETHMVEIPIYEAIYHDKKLLGLKSSNYQLIDAATQPLTIDLNKPEATAPTGPVTKPATGGQAQQAAGGTMQIQVPEYQEIEIPTSPANLPPEPVGGGGGQGGDSADSTANNGGQQAAPIDVAVEISEIRSQLENASADELNSNSSPLMQQWNKLNAYGLRTSVIAERDSIAALKAEIDKKKSELNGQKTKRTIWMVIGGALLAILMFVGNHALKTLRNRSQMRSMQELQDRAMHQAEGKVKQATQRVVDQQVNKAEQAVKRTASGSLRAVRGTAREHGTAEQRAQTGTPARKRTGDPQPPVDRSKETLQQKAERAARGARIKKHRDSDGNVNI